jgi:hypothetical protein
MLIFEWILFAENSKKLQKLSLKEKISWTLNVFTFPNLESFNSKNVKKKRMCHNWANGIKSILFRSCPKSFGMFTCWFTEGEGSLGKGVWQTVPVGAGCFGKNLKIYWIISKYYKYPILRLNQGLWIQT